jgi:hypothetical protein
MLELIRSNLHQLVNQIREDLRGLWQPKPVPRNMWDRVDVALAGVLTCAAFVLYINPGLQLSQGVYYQYYNLGFDYDPYRVYSLLTEASPDKMGFKHPFLIVFRPLGLALMALGFSPASAVAMVMAACGACTLTLAWTFLRLAGIGRPESLALVALFSVSATQLITAIVPETYGFAGLTIAFVWVIAVARQGHASSFQRERLAAAALAAGVTTTNLIQAIIAEWFIPGMREDVQARLRRVIAMLVLLIPVIMLASLLVWHRELWIALNDPLLALKQILWMQPKGEKAGIVSVAQTFLGLSFVAPDWSWVPLPEGTNMRDWREWSFSGTGQVAAPLWLGMLLAGSVAGLSDRNFRPIAIALLVTLAFNLVFHLRYQYRESLFLYAAHTHFLCFALASGLATVAAGRMYLRVAFVGLTLTLATLTAANNLPKAFEFANAFEKAETPCPAPCAHGS